jgi:hypothetical protein
MSDATGWAVLVKGGPIYVKTVSETRRGAIVNWLVVEHGALIMNHHTDADIERMWTHYGKYVDCQEVSITSMTKGW